MPNVSDSEIEYRYGQLQLSYRSLHRAFVWLGVFTLLFLGLVASIFVWLVFRAQTVFIELLGDVPLPLFTTGVIDLSQMGGGWLLPMAIVVPLISALMGLLLRDSPFSWWMTLGVAVYLVMISAIICLAITLPLGNIVPVIP